MTIEEIWKKAKIDKNITEKKKQIINQQYKKIDGEKIFSIGDGIFMMGNGWWYQVCWEKEY